MLNIEQGGLKVERDDMEFQHHFFIQGQPELLPHIKRKVTQPGTSSNNAQSATSNQVALMQQDALIERANMEEKVDNLEMSLKVLQATQDVVNEQLVQIKRENGTLWHELSVQRQKHLKQQQITHKLLQFIMHQASGSSSGRQRGSISLGKRKFPPLMIDQPPKRSTHADGLTHSASIDNALEAIEDVFAVSPDVQPSSGPIIREIPLEVYEASVAAAAASSSSASSSSSNGQSSSSTRIAPQQPQQQQHVPLVSSTVTQPTFATAVAEDGSTVLLMQTNPGMPTGSNAVLPTQVPFMTAVPSQQQQQQQSMAKQPVPLQPRQPPPQLQRQQQIQQQPPQPVYKYEMAPATISTTIPIITPADSPAEHRQAPSPAYSIHSVPSPASVSAPSPKPANITTAAPLINNKAPIIVSSAPSTSTGATTAHAPVTVPAATSKSNVTNGKRGIGAGNKNLPPLNTSSNVSLGNTKPGITPEIIDTPTLTDFISQFPIVSQASEDGAPATALLRSKTGASVKTDTLGAAIMLSGVHADEHELEEDAAVAAAEDAATTERQAQSPSPRGLARSLSKKIDTVDAGLEGIKDMLVAQSPDLNMDPSELLNLFMPDGPITTDPRTPIALDDFLEAGTSPFNWPSTPATSTARALPAPDDKKMDLITPKPDVRK